jgi:hypothetical protein
MSTLYEYAIIYNPRPTKDTQGNDTTPPSEIISPITSILAKSEQEVSIKAARAIPDKYLDKLDEVTIAIRPF